MKVSATAINALLLFTIHTTSTPLLTYSESEIEARAFEHNFNSRNDQSFGEVLLSPTPDPAVLASESRKNGLQFENLGIASEGHPHEAGNGGEAEETQDRKTSDTPVFRRSLLEKRRGGGGGGGKGGGGGGSSSGGGKSGSSDSGSGGSGSSGSGRSSSTTTTTPRTFSSGGRYYSGGSTSSYSAGQRSPGGIAPYFLAGGIAGAAIYSIPFGYWGLYGLYAYPWSRPYYYHNTTDPNPSSNETLPVVCYCAAYSACGCDDNGNTTFITSLLANGTGMAQIETVNGTREVVLNGTLANGTVDDTSGAAGSASSFVGERTGVCLFATLVGALMLLL